MLLFSRDLKGGPSRVLAGIVTGGGLEAVEADAVAVAVAVAVLVFVLFEPLTLEVEKQRPICF